MSETAEMIDRDAALWVARMADPDTRAEERAAFRAWLAQSAAHRDAAGRCAAAWQSASPLRDDLSFRAERRRARRWRLANARDGARAGWQRPLRAGLSFAAVAAVVALVLPWSQLFPAAPVPVRYATSQEQRLTTTLEDGSVATLDLDTEIVVTTTDKTRRVQVVKGEVFLVVKHDKARPLDAFTDLVNVRATGTEFSVRALRDATRVVLVEGGVQVTDRSAPATKVALKPGQEAQMSSQQHRLLVRPIDPVAALAWRQGRVVFRATPLAEAVAQINRYAARPIMLDARLNGAQEINGTFDAADTQKFAQTLVRILPLNMREQADGSLLLEMRRN